VIAMLLMVSALPCVFLKVAVCAALATPIGWLPKDNLEGLNVLCAKTLGATTANTKNAKLIGMDFRLVAADKNLRQGLPQLGQQGLSICSSRGRGLAVRPRSNWARGLYRVSQP
jgi:hypothetical protein